VAAGIAIRLSRTTPNLKSMSDPEKKVGEHNTHNAPNITLPRTGFMNRRSRAVVEMETGAAGEGGRLPGMTREYSGWDVYNNEAKKVDTELVNDWRDSLNSLLLFVSIPVAQLRLILRFKQASIFAAVLTAFIIESKKVSAAFTRIRDLNRFPNRCSSWTQRP
jgi:Family of unknown function (DUF6535)